MIIPIRCQTCGKPIAHLWDAYQKQAKAGISPKIILDKLEIERFCCRSVFLTHTNIVEKGEFFEFTSKKGEKKRMPMWYYKALQEAKTPEQRRTLRSKTFKGIAEAMANQWTNLEFIKNNKTSQTNIFDL